MIFEESDMMIKISEKVNKSTLTTSLVVIFRSLLKELHQTKHFLRFSINWGKIN